MRIYEDLDSIPNAEKGCVAAVGNFDGVHLGHQVIFTETVATADKMSTHGLVLTFSSHPASILEPDRKPGIVMTLKDRLHFASQLGIKAALVLPFDRRMAALAAEEFVERVLVGALGVCAVVAGENWRFGKNRMGDIDQLARLGKKSGFAACGVPPVSRGDEPVSSTRIRDSLARGKVELARKLLGRPHFVRGKVVSGEGRGRDLGFPTVNLDCGGVVLPAKGVYSGAFTSEGVLGPCAVNVGTRPTFGSGQQTVEAHLIGVEGDYYGRQVTLSFLTRLRDEVSFEDEISLKNQISRDVGIAARIFSESGVEGIVL